MTIAPDDARRDAHLYQVMREFVARKMRDYPLLGIPVYAVFDPRTGSGAVLSDIHRTPDGPRYATRKDFPYGEDVTIAEWTIPTDGLPRYA